MEYIFRKATQNEIPQIWDILQQAIVRRKEDGSTQWQDGYPNTEVITRDIEKGVGHVLTFGDVIVGYCAVLINDEPAYAEIEGRWLTDGDFVVYHRVAIADDYLGKGLAKKMLRFVEEFARNHGIDSVRADTNHDNFAMLSIFERLGYVYCGEVYFRGSARRAYEKVFT